MQETKSQVLIEVGAQHPLVDGMPGEEFELRLRKGIKLYNEEKTKGNNPIIYIPGSLHSIKVNGEWQSDKNSLSTAGKLFLIQNNIPIEDIYSDEANEKFKSDGVYNSGDECLVATQIAKENGIERIISVVSPVQVYRKALFYLEYGFEPEMYGVGLENTYHNYIGEVFWSLYITYFIDNTWQHSFLAAKTREERDRNYKITREIQELIDAGIVLPDIVKTKRMEWMELYKKAQENMNSRADNKDIVISLVLTGEEIEEEKIDTLLQICSQYGDEEGTITVCIQGTENKIVEEKLVQVLGNNIKIVSLDNFQEQLEFYDKSLASKWYHITDSPTSIKEAILAIKQGVLPIIFSVPNKELSYIDNIQDLYLDILQVEHKRVKDEVTVGNNDGTYGEDSETR